MTSRCQNDEAVPPSIYTKSYIYVDKRELYIMTQNDVLAVNGYILFFRKWFKLNYVGEGDTMEG